MEYTEEDAMNLEEFKEVNTKEQNRLDKAKLDKSNRDLIVTNYVIWFLGMCIISILLFDK